MNKISFPKFKSYNGQSVRYIQPKFDGHLMKIYKEQKIAGICNVHVFTKNDKDVTDKIWQIQHIRNVLVKLPNQSIVFAELHFPGGFSTDVPTMLNNADERLQLTAFAAPMVDGENMVDARLPGVMLILQDYGVGVSHTRILNSIRTVVKSEQEELIQLAIEDRLEGYVLKEGHMTGWYKLKPVKELDAFVIGTCQSFSAQHYGGLKSIQVAVLDDNGKIHDLGQVGSGFEADYRAQFNTKEKRATLTNRVCEIQYDSIAANGKLRFPRFIRWRDDKDKKDCATEQFE